MNIFISGGCKNGKSFHAQELARDMARERGAKLYYIATMIPKDDEDRIRIKRHLKAREGWGFTTVEIGTHLMGILEGSIKDENGEPVDPSGVFLMDSVTALLSNEMFDTEGNFDESAGERVRDEVVAFAKGTGSTVFVSDYIYSDANIYADDFTENYRKALAGCDVALAKACDQVIEVSFGTFRTIKG